MIVLLIAALAIAALLAGGVVTVRSHARERQRRAQLRRTRLTAAAAAESRAEEERHRAALEASDALTSVLPAIRLPWPRQPQGSAPYDDGDPSFSDYPRFPADVPFQAQEEPAWYRDEKPGRYAAAGQAANGQAEHVAGFPAERQAPPAFPAERTPGPAFPAERLAPTPPPSEWTAPVSPLAEHGAPADHPHRRPGHGSHRGGHAKRRR